MEKMEIKKTKLKRFGNLWKIKNGLKGTIDLGILGKKTIVILKNLKKQKDTSPDYYLYFDTGEPTKKIESDEL